VREIVFDPLQERNAAEHLSDAGGMDPNGSFEGKLLKESHPLG
jgi:hypothetical protein